MLGGKCSSLFPVNISCACVSTYNIEKYKYVFGCCQHEEIKRPFIYYLYLCNGSLFDAILIWAMSMSFLSLLCGFFLFHCIGHWKRFMRHFIVCSFNTSIARSTNHWNHTRFACMLCDCAHYGLLMQDYYTQQQIKTRLLWLVFYYYYYFKTYQCSWIGSKFSEIWHWNQGLQFEKPIKCTEPHSVMQLRLPMPTIRTIVISSTAEAEEEEWWWPVCSVGVHFPICCAVIFVNT